MVNDIWKREFCPRFLRVDHHKPHQFVVCQWQHSQQVHLGYFIYRWCMATLFLTIMICSICDVNRNEKDFGVPYIKWPIYLTNWGYTVYTFQALLGAFLVTQQYVLEKKHGNYVPVRKRLNFGYKVYWVTHTISVVSSLGITICYWAAVYNPEMHKLDALNILVHACNSIFMVIDFLLVAHPFRLLHCYWPFLFTGLYILFNFIYFELGGTDRHDRAYIYPLLDWRNPRKSLLVTVFGLIFVLVVHSIVWILFLLKRWLSGSLSSKSEITLNGEVYRQPNSECVQMDVVEC